MAPVMGKPARSDDVDMDPDQQARLTQAIRQKFADKAPKRPLKPSRSDDLSADVAAAATFSLDGPIPEHLKLQQLLENSPPQAIVCEYPAEASQEFVETEYYKDLRAADQKLHHTTGTGFIQVETNGSVNLNSSPQAPIATSEVSNGDHNVEPPEEFVETEYYKDLIAADKSLHHTTGTGFIQVEKNKSDFKIDVSSPNGLTRTKSGCNPATNDWIPSEDTMDSYISKKPPRSEPQV